MRSPRTTPPTRWRRRTRSSSTHRPGLIGLETALALDDHEPGRPRPPDAVGGDRPALDDTRPGSSVSTTTARSSEGRRGERRRVRSRAEWTVDPHAFHSKSINTPFTGRSSPAAWCIRSSRGRHIVVRRQWSRRWSWYDRTPACAARTRGRNGLPGSVLRRDRDEDRRGLLQHRHDRLPGGPHRPLVPRTDRDDDGTADRQHRRQRSTTSRGDRGSPGSSCATCLRVRPRGGRREPCTTYLDEHGVPGIIGRRHAPAHAAHQGPRSDAGALSNEVRDPTNWSTSRARRPSLIGRDLAREVTTPSRTPGTADLSVERTARVRGGRGGGAGIGELLERPDGRTLQGRRPRLRHEAEHPGSARRERLRRDRAPGRHAGRDDPRAAATRASSSRTARATPSR